MRPFCARTACRWGRGAPTGGDDLAATPCQSAVGRSDREAYRSRAYEKTRDEIATAATSSRATGVLSGIRP